MGDWSVAIFGAGNIGRGLIAEIVTSAGGRPVFIEAHLELLQALRAAKSYDIRLTGQFSEIRTITGYDIVDANDTDSVIECLTCCEFAATAVGGENLPKIAPVIASAIHKRSKPLNIIVCENWPHADEVMSKVLQVEGAVEGRYACARCSVERMVRRADDSLDLLAESGQTLYVDGSAWLGDRPNIRGMSFVQDVDAYYARKIYTNNAGHALLGYLGTIYGCELLCDALETPNIRRALYDMLELAGQALVQRFGLDENAMRDHIYSLATHRYANRELADTVARVARGALRKLGPEERLVGLIRLLQSCDLPTEPVSQVIGAALCYCDSSDSESIHLQQMITDSGAESVLESVCKFDKSEPCYREALQFYQDYKTGGCNNEQAAHIP
ncbi:MAG: mannitol dehydrogenase family protein [Armatimonadota bacterium]